MYMTRFHSISNSEKYKNYLNESVQYLQAQALAEIQKVFPDVDMSTINLNDEKYKDIVQSLAYSPKIMGNLAVSLGLDDKVMTEQIWEDMFHGYVKEEHLPESSHLRAYVIDTPRGRMLPLNNSAGKIGVDGEYIYDGQRRSATEGIFTLGKGLSTWIVGRELEQEGTIKRVEDIHNRVMQEKILPKITELSRFREVIKGNQKGETVKKDGFEVLGVSFMHLENRAVEPNIHFHFELMNTTMSEDGRLYALDTDLIFQNKNMLSSLYMAYMKEEMESEFNIPFEKVILKKDLEDENIKEEDKTIASYDISTEIVPESIVEHYSTRIKEIEEELRKKGLKNSNEARVLAQKSTREEKTELSPSEMLSKWKEEFKELGFKAIDLSNFILKKKPKQLIEKTEQPLVHNFHRKIFRDAIDKVSSLFITPKIKPPRIPLINREHDDKRLTDNKLIHSFIGKAGTVEFTLSQFTGHMITQLLDTYTADEAIKEAHKLAEEHCVLHIPKDREEYYKDYLDGKIEDPVKLRDIEIEFEQEARFITKTVMKWSEEIHHSLKARENETQFLIDSEIVNRMIMKYEQKKGFQLSVDQLEDIRKTFSEEGAVICTAGMAGAGKSTSAEVKVNIWESQGFNVWGTSVAETATKGLASSAGIKKSQCVNSAKLLVLIEKGQVTFNSKTILIFDEAGMADLKTLHKLIMYANQVGAKINFVGEKEQLQPIGIGSSFKYLNENFTTIPLTTINRQRREEDKANVKLLQSGQGEVALKQLFDEGKMLINKTNIDTFHKVAQLYVDNPKPVEDKLIMSAVNADNDTINELVKQKLIEKGFLIKDPYEVEVTCKDGVKRKFGKGDRVSFFRKTKTDDAISHDIDNSSTGTVKSLRKNLTGRVVAMVIEMDELDEHGEKIQHFISLDRKRPALRHGWSQTVHKAQGASKEDTYRVMTSANTDSHMEYVAGSRHKDNFTLLISEEFIDYSLQKMKFMPVSKKQMKKMVWLEKTQSISVPEYAFENYGQARKFLQTYIDLQMPNNPTHILDDYSELIKSTSRRRFKKNVSDFSSIKDGYNLFSGITERRSKKVEEFKEGKENLVPVDKKGLAL